MLPGKTSTRTPSVEFTGQRLWLLLFLLLFLQTAIAQEQPLVVATASMIQDLARNIGGDNFRYHSIVPIGSDPHLYEPTPGDVRIVNSADVILKNGLTFEGWLGRLIDNAGGKVIVRTVTEGIVPIASLKYANATDPHAWMSAANGLIYCQNIRDAFIEVMPEKEAEFNSNYEDYRIQLEELDRYISSKLAQIPEEKRVLITSHDAFQYYGRRYNMRLEAVMGVSTDADVQTSDIRRLNEVIKETGVPAVFIESTINPQILQQIARDNGVSIGGELYADSLSDIEGPAGTYLKMLRHNTDVIFKGLTSMIDLTQSDEGQGPSFNPLWILLLAPIGMALVVFLIRMVRT